MTARVLLLFIACLSIQVSAQKVPKEKDIQGTWEWTGIIESNKSRKIQKKDSVILPIPVSLDRNWEVSFEDGKVKCMDCAGFYNTKIEPEVMEINLSMDCKKWGTQCFFSNGHVVKKGKRTLILTVYYGKDSFTMLELTKVKNE